MGAFSPSTAEGGAISSGSPSPVAVMHRDGAFELRCPEAARRFTPRLRHVHAQRLLKRPEPLGGVGAAGELGEILRMHHGAGLAHLFRHPCVDGILERLEWHAPGAGESHRRHRDPSPAPRRLCAPRRASRWRTPTPHPSAPVTGGGDAPGALPCACVIGPRLRHRRPRR